MTLYTFNLLPYERQLVLVADTATFLATRWQQQEAVKLYFLPGIDTGVFVELYYDAAGQEVVRLKAFTSTAPLTDYAVDVRLPDLE